MKKILLLVATIYTLIAPITYHPDTKLVLYYATLGNEKVWNIYKYLNENIDFAPKFHYPPMNYWMVKSELPIVKLVGGDGIVKWLNVGSNVAFLDANIFIYNLATKLPLLLLILATGYFVYLIAQKSGFSENKSRFAALIWYLNPITIYSGVMMGQNDILAILPFIIGFYFYYDYPIIAFLLFGFASSIKSFPLIWAIALAGVYPTQNIVKKICLLLVSVMFYGVTILPFLKYDFFVKDVLNSGLAMRMFEKHILLFGLNIPIVPLLLVLITLVGIKNNMGKSYVGLCKLLVTINLAILGFSNFNPQWFIWVLPFLSVILAIEGNWWVLILMCLGLFGITIMFDDIFLYWGILSPLNPNLINLPFVSNISRYTHVVSATSHSVVVLLFLYWLYVCFWYKNESDK